MLVLAASAAMGSACSEGSGSGSDDPAGALADRVEALLRDDEAPAIVVERLDQLGVPAGGDDLAEAAVTCPAVAEPDPGDEATCTTSVGAQGLDLIVEFGADDAISIVAVAVAP